MNGQQLSAYDAAHSLLRGYLLQDIRMDYMLEGSYGQVPEIEQEALDEMSNAFEYEFQDADAAREAGRHFMKASFMQDEIENWEELKQSPEAQKYMWISDSNHSGSFMNDERWNEVREELEEVCHNAGVDEEYVDHKVKFLKLHEVGDPKYVDHAVKAESIKIEAMISDEHSDKSEDLSKYFLKGVEQHDEWDEELDEETVELVAEYYRKIRELR